MIRSLAEAMGGQDRLEDLREKSPNSSRQKYLNHHEGWLIKQQQPHPGLIKELGLLRPEKFEIREVKEMQSPWARNSTVPLRQMANPGALSGRGGFGPDALMDWFKGKKIHKSPMILLGKSMVSG